VAAVKMVPIFIPMTENPWSDHVNAMLEAGEPATVDSGDPSSFCCRGIPSRAISCSPIRRGAGK
jgi:hypothetical protein